MNNHRRLAILLGLILFEAGLARAQMGISGRVDVVTWDAKPDIKEISSGKYNCRIEVDIYGDNPLVDTPYFYYFSTDSIGQVTTANAFYETFMQVRLLNQGIQVYIQIDSDTKNIISVSLGGKPQGGAPTAASSAILRKLNSTNNEPNNQGAKFVDILGRANQGLRKGFSFHFMPNESR